MPYSTLATVKEYLGLDGTDSEDDQVTAALNAADDRIDKWCGRTFAVAAAVSTRTCGPWDGSLVRLPAELFKLDDLVVKVDTADDGVYDTTLTAAEYFVRGDQAPYRDLIRVSGVWPQPRSGRPSVEVEGFYGYETAVPEAVVQASTMLAARLYQRRSSPLGFQAGIGAELGAVRVSRMDHDVAALLTGYRRLAVA